MFWNRSATQSRQTDFTAEAIDLFTRFAERHRLRYEVDTSAPVEVMWHFPVQEQLDHPISLCLQNGDELNLGILDFWSYFFPFGNVAAEFEGIIDAWVDGRARIAKFPKQRGQALQRLTEGEWITVYQANRIRKFRGMPVETLQNRPLRADV